jgi:hypothetical protein
VLGEVLTIIGGVLVCGGFWTFIQFLIARNDGKKKALDELKKAVDTLQVSMKANNDDMALQNEALMAITQDRILYLCKCYLKQGWIYDDDLAALRRMANVYKAMGGNDLVKTEMDILDSKIKDGVLEAKVR